ncbi:HAMP domain-containing histidine kinase [bacterium]|nr:HAMP domain-containing histidine kinase [bacterium]
MSRPFHAGIPAQLRRAGLFKGFLFLGAVLLAAGLFLITHRIVNEIRESSRSHLTLTVRYYRSLLLSDNPELAYEAVKGIEFPIVLTDQEGFPKFWNNLEVAPDDTSANARKKVLKIVKEMDRLGNKPVPLEVVPGVIDYFHYGDPDIVYLLRWYTIISVIVVAIYILLGYVGFRTIRKAEERSVWIGMARETAHQLGTPISSLMGWLEFLGDKGGDATVKMNQDLKRLEQIAVRFSKIGAKEKLKVRSLNNTIKDSVSYMRSRVGSSVEIELSEQVDVQIPLQPELIGWVLENLIRNAAQAMAGDGKISINCGEEKNTVFVDVKDTGPGISTRDFETIFRPGYTTKKRGWGLGLSLGRRILQETHNGRLFVKESRIGGGTTFRLVLKK